MSESVSVEELLLQLSCRAAEMERADMARERAMAAQVEETAATAAAAVEETTTVDPVVRVLADDTVAAVLTGSSNSLSLIHI